jgi:hypothetical protein
MQNKQPIQDKKEREQNHCRIKNNGQIFFHPKPAGPNGAHQDTFKTCLNAGL